MKRYVRASVNLYGDQNDTDRFLIARDTPTVRDIRDIANTETESIVLMALASNPNTPADVLLELARKGNDSVAKYALRNPNASIELIDELFGSSLAIGKYAKEYILREASDSNMGVDQNFLKKCTQSRYPRIRGTVASNPAAHEDVQLLLANDSNYEVLWNLVNNILVYKRCLEELTRNPDEDIRSQAEKRLAEEDYITP